MENYPEYPVADLNYAGHPIKILVTKNEIWSPGPPF